MRVPKGLSRGEQESFFRTSAEARAPWEFYGRDPKWKRRLEKKGYEVKEDAQGLWSCELPAGSLTIRRADRQKRKPKPGLKPPFLSRERVNLGVPGVPEGEGEAIPASNGDSEERGFESR